MNVEPMDYVFHAINKRPIRVLRRTTYEEAKERLKEKHPDFRIIEVTTEFEPKTESE